MEEMKNNETAVSVEDALAMTLNTLDKVSIPASVLGVLTPAGIQNVMQQVIAPIQQAKQNLMVLLNYEKQRAEEAKAAPEDAPEIEVVPMDPEEAEPDESNE